MIQEKEGQNNAMFNKIKVILPLSCIIALQRKKIVFLIEVHEKL